MSNQQGPGQGSPWSAPDPDWHPSAFAEHSGRDPRQPFGGQPAAASLPDLAAPRKPVWPWVIGVLVVVSAVLGALLLFPGSQETPSATEGPKLSAFPTPTVTGNAIPYEGNGTGTLTITAHRWVDDGVEVDYTLTSDAGARTFAFFAFLNETRQSFVPEGDPSVEVDASGPSSGTLMIRMPRGDVSLVLTTASGRALTALPLAS